MKSRIGMHTVRRNAIDQALFELKYPGRGKEARATVQVSRLIDYHMKKTWRYGWNACAAFTQSFPEGERLDEQLERNGMKGGLRVMV